MEEKNYNYSEKAAKWWADKVRNEAGTNVPGILSFEELLEKEIRKLNGKNGSLTISTYCTRSFLLDNVAKLANLRVEVPIGYEMKILVDSVSVYNSNGILVSSF